MNKINLESPSPTGPKTVARVEAVKARVFLGIAAGLIVFLLILWYAIDVFLLIFASILVSVFLRRLTGFVHAMTGLKHGACLAIVLFVMVVLFLSVAWLLVPETAAQMETLVEQVPMAWQRLRSQLEQYAWVRHLLSSALVPAEGGKAAVSAIPTVLSRGGTLLGALIFVIFSGVFLALEPDVYLRNFEKLFPVSRRPRVHEVLLGWARPSRAGWLRNSS